MRTFRDTYKWIAAAALAVFAMAAQAVPITGNISIAGAFQLVDANGNLTTSLASATGIDFNPYGPPSSTGDIVVTSATKSFSGIPFLAMGTITDFQFAPFSGPINSFWDLSSVGFTFDLLSLSSVVKTPGPGTSGGISIFGTGVINSTIAGLSSTLGNWSLSGDSSTGAIFGWSSTTSPVPEPTSLMLIGIGLLGFGFVRALKQLPRS